MIKKRRPIEGSLETDMARIVENPEGRRMIRLSAEDVLTVVSLYQQQLYEVRSRNYDEVHQQLTQQHIYLPEEL